jgi:putative FmdB family regulatory protein
MPRYCYICEKCGHKFEEIRNVGDHVKRCPKCDDTNINRDYLNEFSGVGVDTDDWDPGYNYGISEFYENKTDLLKKIRKKGFEPSRYCSLGKVRRELYGEERRFDEQQKKKKDNPVVVIED